MQLSRSTHSELSRSPPLLARCPPLLGQRGTCSVDRQRQRRRRRQWAVARGTKPLAAPHQKRCTQRCCHVVFCWMRTLPLVQVLPLDLLHLSFHRFVVLRLRRGRWRHPPIAQAEAAQGGRAGRGAAPAQHARQTILKNCSRQRARMTCKAPSLPLPPQRTHSCSLSHAEHTQSTAQRRLLARRNQPHLIFENGRGDTQQKQAKAPG